jgi:multidrug efflux system outer membrane protein
MRQPSLRSRARGIFQGAATTIMACTLAACAVGPAYQPPAPSDAGVPLAWHAQLPHSGRVIDLAQWWMQFDDPLLSALILSSQNDSPTIAQAEARVRQARAALDSSAAAFFPSLSLDASITRSNGTGIAATSGASTVQTLGAATLSSSWDFDLFGGTRRSIEAGSARLAGSQADWHDSRVSLAAEVANAYVARRQCEALMVQNEIDLASRIETHRLTGNKVASGFSAPADALRTEASVAESTSLQQNQKGLCARNINQLAALTGIPPADLEARLKPGHAVIPLPAAVSVPAIPAAVISQRPDVASIERALAAASADIGVAVANRLPQLGLAGTIGINRLRIGNAVTRYDTWSFYPSLSLPIFDGGSGAAQVTSSRARYDELLAAYKARIRQAVQEVEDALVRIDIAAQREQATELAEARYQQYFDAKKVQFRLGATSLLDLEDARRITVGSKQSLAAVRLERAQSWIALYKSVGGGWQAAGSQDSKPVTAPSGK